MTILTLLIKYPYLAIHMIGYIFVLLSVVAFSTVNITDKVVSGIKDRYASLLVRYFFAILIGSTILIFSGERFVFPDVYYSWILILVGALYYLTNLFMYAGLKHLNTGTFFMIGYLYLIFLFFINIWLFSGTEILSPLKTVMAFAFMFLVMYMVYDTGRGKKGDLLGYTFAFVCAIGWMIGFGVEGFIIKNNIVSPVMTIFVAYIGAVSAAIISFLVTRKHHGYIFWEKKKELMAPILGGTLISVGSASLLMAYSLLPINIVNTISISDLLVTTIFSVIFLKEKLHKKQWIFLVIGFLVLGGFVSVR